eukprot:gene12176-5666_t
MEKTKEGEDIIRKLLDKRYLILSRRSERGRWYRLKFVQQNFELKWKKFSKIIKLYTDCISNLILKGVYSRYYFGLIFYIARNEDSVNYFSKLDELPVVLVENFEKKCSGSKIFEYFVDNFPLLKEYIRINLDTNVTDIMRAQLDLLEQGKYKPKTMESNLSQFGEKEMIGSLKKKLDELEKEMEDFWIDEIDSKNKTLKYAPLCIRKNPRIVKLCLKWTTKNLKFADFSIRDDDEFIEMIFKNYDISKCYNMLSPRLKKNRKFALKAVQNKPLLYKYVPVELKRDKEFILNSIGSPNAEDISYDIPKDLYADKNFVLELINFPQFYFSQLTEEMKNDPEVILKSVKGDLYRLRDINLQLVSKNEELLKELLKIIKFDQYSFYSSGWCSDNDIIQKMIPLAPNSFQYISSKMKTVENFKLFLQFQTNDEYEDADNISREIKTNEQLLQFAMVQRFANIIFFDPETPGYLKCLMKYLEQYFIQNSNKNVANDFLENQLSPSASNYFRKKIYLWNSIDEILKTTFPISLSLIDVKDEEIEDLRIFSKN